MSEIAPRMEPGDMVANPTRVTVIIPAFNAAKFVLEAIRSVDRQEYSAIEMLLIDDGSRDDTVELVRREAPRVRVIQQANAGAAAARNTGLRHATGELICFLDADDGWFPGKLAAQVDYLALHPEVGAVYHDWLVWKPDDTGAYLEPKRELTPIANQVDYSKSGWIYPQLLLSCIVHTSTVMIRRDVVCEVGGFDTGLATGEDYNYWLRVSRRCEIHKLSGIYSFYREVAGSLTTAPNAANNEYRVLRQAIEQWGLSSPHGDAVHGNLMRKRLADLAFDFGYTHYHRGSANLAKDAFTQALRHDPLRWRALAYLLVTMFR